MLVSFLNERPVYRPQHPLEGAFGVVAHLSQTNLFAVLPDLEQAVLQR